MRNFKTKDFVSGKSFSEALPRDKFLCFCVSFSVLFTVLFTVSCNQISPPKSSPFIGKIAPSQDREFRWSNGKTPKSFDPALATAAPETDIVRAIFEGLTEIDAKTLEPLPAIALKYESSADSKTWTFELRRDAKWTNGEIVTAHDFVKSWKRLTELGEKVSQRDLLKNIVGMNTEDVLPIFADENLTENANANSAVNNLNSNAQGNSNIAARINQNTATILAPNSEKNVFRKTLGSDAKFGVEAVADFTLKVSLIQPDRNFPSLVAHPIFRPIYGDGSEFANLNTDIITNGAFHLVSVEKGVLIKPSENFYQREKINVESVRFVAAENTEAALTAYRAGEVDAVTNASLQPLTRKLLIPYEKEFHQTKHGAINLYEFNFSNKPFDEPRIREALTIAIERERITEIEMQGSTKPAFSFLPFEGKAKFAEDIPKARKILADAGFENGKNFPFIKLLINRNDMQKRVARMVAKMWKENLNVETEIIVKDQADYENALKNGEYDVVRRGVTLPTTDETVNMTTIFDPLRRQISFDVDEEMPNNVTENNSPAQASNSNTNSQSIAEKVKNVKKILQLPQILSEEQAFEIYPAIPLYFPMSYSLVKPYVKGFDTNLLDAPSLKNVEIDYDWRDENAKKSNVW